MIVKGVYRKGMGKAHLVCDHRDVFGEKMYGTFNVRAMRSIEKFRPSNYSLDGNTRYWRIIINSVCEAWVVRWKGTSCAPTYWEIISRQPLPLELRQGTLRIEIMEPLTA